MKTKKINIILGAFTTILLASCSTSLSYTTLDVLRPAKISFEPNVQNILLVNNSVTQPSNIGHKTQLLDEKATDVSIKTDSLSLFSLAALKEELDNKKFFLYTPTISKSINTSKDFRTTVVLDQEKVKKLCNEYQTEAILSLEKIKVNDDIIQYYLPETATILSVLELRFETNWNLYYPDKQSYTALSFKDTLFWEQQSYSKSQSLKKLPKRSDALIDGALYVGQKTVNRITPYWDKIDRYFFDSKKKLMKRGMDSLITRNWSSAISFWQIALRKTKSKKIKLQAANNIAVAYEITGDIDNAMNYATMAYNEYSSLPFANYQELERLENYVNDLALRKKELEILKKQIGE